jgi:hypothetical protein
MNRIFFGTLKSAARVATKACSPLGGLLAFAQHHGGADFLAQLGVRHAEAHHLRHRGMVHQDSSTSRGEIFSPPRLMISFRRPVS